MTGLEAVGFPAALVGASIAGFSYRDGIRAAHHRSTAPRGARWARRRDLRPLLINGRMPVVGRLTLGRLLGPGRGGDVAGERGQSLVVVGPTQSGKTTSLVVPAILGWRGPVIAASVKSDIGRMRKVVEDSSQAALLHRIEELLVRSDSQLTTLIAASEARSLAQLAKLDALVNELTRRVQHLEAQVQKLSAGRA